MSTIVSWRHDTSDNKTQGNKTQVWYLCNDFLTLTFKALETERVSQCYRDVLWLWAVLHCPRWCNFNFNDVDLRAPKS